jgi:hypothetical protein
MRAKVEGIKLKTIKQAVGEHKNHISSSEPNPGSSLNKSKKKRFSPRLSSS